MASVKTRKHASSVTLRQKGQLTLPADVCRALGVKAGDYLELTVEGSRIILRPSHEAALDALTELRHAIAESGVTEAELIASGEEIAKEQFRRDYPELADELGI